MIPYHEREATSAKTTSATSTNIDSQLWIPLNEVVNSGNK